MKASSKTAFKWSVRNQAMRRICSKNWAKLKIPDFRKKKKKKD